MFSGADNSTEPKGFFSSEFSSTGLCSGTVVGSGTIIGSGAVVGSGTVAGSGTVVGSGTIVGSGFAGPSALLRGCPVPSNCAVPEGTAAPDSSRLVGGSGVLECVDVVQAISGVSSLSSSSLPMPACAADTVCFGGLGSDPGFRFFRATLDVGVEKVPESRPAEVSFDLAFVDVTSLRRRAPAPVGSGVATVLPLAGPSPGTRSWPRDSLLEDVLAGISGATVAASRDVDALSFNVCPWSPRSLSERPLACGSSLVAFNACVDENRQRVDSKERNIKCSKTTPCAGPTPLAPRRSALCVCVCVCLLKLCDLCRGMLVGI